MTIKLTDSLLASLGGRPLWRPSFVWTQDLSVFQWGSAACVQRLGYGSAGFPAPGEALLTADRPTGGDIALSGHRKVTRGTTSHIDCPLLNPSACYHS